MGFETVCSADGTSIAFERFGEGPALITVGGATCDRALMRPTAQSAGAHLTAVTYDRRGRGDSGDTLPYAVEREVEDLDAMVSEAGGSASVFGVSSGAASPSRRRRAAWRSTSWPCGSRPSTRRRTAGRR